MASERGVAERGSLTSRAGIVAAGTVVSRLLGLVREMVLAALFRTDGTDAFFVALTIPSTLRQLLGEGAMASAVVPVLTETREQQGEQASRDLFRVIRGASLVTLLVGTVVGMVVAPELCALFAPGLRATPRQFERTVTLTRVVFPMLLFAGTAALGAAALNVARKFAVAAFSPALVNAGLIVFAVLAPSWLAAHGLDPAVALALGVLFGGGAQVLAQWPALRRSGYQGMPRLDLGHPGVRVLARRLLPTLIGTGVFFLNVALARRFLSHLGEGAQSYFTWAFRLCDLPQGVFVVAIATVVLPSLASSAALGDRYEVARTYALGMRLSLFVALPATALLTVLAHPVVVVCFERGQFGAAAAAETARALGAQAAGLWAIAVTRQLAAAFFALGDTRAPTVAAVANLLAFVGLAHELAARLDHVGVGLAFTGGNVVQAVVLWVLLRRRLPTLRLREVAGSVSRTAAASGAAALAAWALVQALGGGDVAAAGAWSRAWPGLLGSAAFGLVFLAAAWGLGSPELRQLAGALRRRLCRDREPRP